MPGAPSLRVSPVGLLHPFQIDEVVQRGQRHTSLRSCQFSYPLSFRGQVCEAQGPLPCFPPTVLSTWHPSFLDRVQVSPVPLFASLPRSTRSSLLRVSQFALPVGRRDLPGQGHCSTGYPNRRFARTRT